MQSAQEIIFLDLNLHSAHLHLFHYHFLLKKCFWEKLYFKIVKTVTFSIFPCYLQVLFFYRHKYSFSIGKKWLFGERFIIFSERRVQIKYRQLFDRRQPDPIKSVLLVIIGWLVTQFSQKRLQGFFWFFAWS